MTKGKYERTPEIRAKIANSVRSKAIKNAKDPAWREAVSIATKKRMHDPDVRKKHLEGLKFAFAGTENGNNFVGGQGQVPNELEQRYAWLLGIGYESNVQFIVGDGRWFRLDYALTENKICFEIDGSSHRGKNRQKKDAARDKILKAAGWIVIRIRHA